MEIEQLFPTLLFGLVRIQAIWTIINMDKSGSKLSLRKRYEMFKQHSCSRSSSIPETPEYDFSNTTLLR